MGEMMTVLVGNRKRPLERARRKWENVRSEVRGIGY
jgi:hypothetical protein